MKKVKFKMAEILKPCYWRPLVVEAETFLRQRIVEVWSDVTSLDRQLISFISVFVPLKTTNLCISSTFQNRFQNLMYD